VRIDSLPPTRTCRAVARPIADHMAIAISRPFWQCAAASREAPRSVCGRCAVAVVGVLLD
jgi:hypothetical protein